MIGTSELLLILIVALVLFGGKRLPELAKSLGLAMQEFRKASSGEYRIEDSVEDNRSKENPSDHERQP
jgi:sec-independent protein translocase protein TatA